VRQLRPLLQDQLAHAATHLHAFGREQLDVDPFLLLGCKDLPSDDAELIRALVGQRHGLALLSAFRPALVILTRDLIAFFSAGIPAATHTRSFPSPPTNNPQEGERD